MTQALADAMPLLGGMAFGFGEATVDVGDAARETGNTGHAAFEAATAIGKRRATPAERPDVGDVVNYENYKRGREADQHSGPRQVFQHHHTYSSMCSELGGARGGSPPGRSGARRSSRGVRRLCDPTFRPTGGGKVGTGGAIRS